MDKVHKSITTQYLHQLSTCPLPCCLQIKFVSNRLLKRMSFAGSCGEICGLTVLVPPLISSNNQLLATFPEF
jgi:hypothetical protein